MKKIKMKGFTLVELLAVIVILAIILVIAVPKVMSVIEDAKKATLESTAMMIASSAEKAKVQNTLLSNNKGINCEDIVQINDMDYERCIIEYDDENNALVTIKGSGKFDNLYVCEGNKTSATASNENCEVSYGNASAYIEKLEAFTSDNGLIIDDTADKNIRYAGSNPSNKVYFNCKDTDSNGIVYGETDYDYANSCEIWRIIGVFDVDNGSGKVEKRVKLVREVFTDSSGTAIGMSWDSSVNNGGTDNNSGNGINQWGESTYEDGTFYEGADLMRMLNGYYIRKDDTTCNYCTGSNQRTCENDCSSSITPLSDTTLSMVDDTLWKTGGQSWLDPMPLETMYVGEQSTTIGKKCVKTSEKDGKKLCTDTVNRTTEWVGKIGLIYPSDYGYASTAEDCGNDIYGDDSSCENNNWLSLSSWYWTFSPYVDSLSAEGVWHVNPPYNVKPYNSFGILGVRPSLYLSTNVQIIGGDGSTEPYKLSI